MEKADVEVTPVSDAQAEEYRRRAEADVIPTETPRERLARLTAEVKELEATAVAEEKAEAAAKVLPAVRELVKLIEAQQPGKVCRALTVRFSKPGDVEPEIVTKLEQGSPGVAITFRVVKPRKAK